MDFPRTLAVATRSMRVDICQGGIYALSCIKQNHRMANTGGINLIKRSLDWTGSVHETRAYHTTFACPKFDGDHGPIGAAALDGAGKGVLNLGFDLARLVKGRRNVPVFEMWEWSKLIIQCTDWYHRPPRSLSQRTLAMCLLHLIQM